MEGPEGSWAAVATMRTRARHLEGGPASRLTMLSTTHRLQLG